MIKNSDLEIFKGIMTISKIDGIVYDSILPLITYFLEKQTTDKEYYTKLFSEEFNPEIAKGIFNIEDKNFFFNTIILIASIDVLSEKEKELILNYSKILDFSEPELKSIVENIQIELNRETDKDSLQWLKRTVKAYITYLENGYTPFEGFYSIRLLHFLTNNRSSEILGFMARVFNPPYRRGLNKNNIMSIKTENEIKNISKDISENSYHVFENRINAGTCKKIINFARKTPCYPSLANQDNFDHITGKRLVKSVIYNPDKSIARRYDFDQKDFIENIDIQKIVSDEIFLKVAQEYFQAKPVLNLVSLWWSSDYQGEPSRYTGQVYHIDIDRMKFLNFFIYLTDVGSDNGSHIYIKGTHNFKPLHLLLDKRMTDEELHETYNNEDFIEIKGKQGTVFAGDTKAYHKGNPLKKGERLVLQLDFSTDRFGENCPRVNINNKSCNSLIELKNKYPYTLINFVE